jgi:hypothetical protein
VFLLDVEQAHPRDLRHGSNEGRLLRHFRAACRRFGAEQPALEIEFRCIGDIFFAFNGARGRADDGAVEPMADEDMDSMISEILEIHKRALVSPKRLHAELIQMAPAARAIWLADGIVDCTLPAFLQTSATAAEKAQLRNIEDSRKRDRGGGAQLTASVKPGEFFCKTRFCRTRLVSLCFPPSVSGFF